MKSTVKFKDIVENLSFVKIRWNGKVIYDDTSYLSGDYTYNEDGETIEHLNKIKEEYGEKYVRSIYIKFDGHHCTLGVKGEK